MLNRNVIKSGFTFQFRKIIGDWIVDTFNKPISDSCTNQGRGIRFGSRKRGNGRSSVVMLVVVFKNDGIVVDNEKGNRIVFPHKAIDLVKIQLAVFMGALAIDKVKGLQGFWQGPGRKNSIIGDIGEIVPRESP